MPVFAFDGLKCSTIFLLFIILCLTLCQSQCTIYSKIQFSICPVVDIALVPVDKGTVATVIRTVDRSVVSYLVLRPLDEPHVGGDGERLVEGDEEERTDGSTHADTTEVVRIH